MPRLPDAMDVPALSSARSGRGVATFDTSAVGRAQESLGNAIASGAQIEGAATQKMADSLSRAGNAALTWQDRADELNEAKALSDLTVRTTKLDAARDDETDPEKLKEYRNHYQDAVNSAASVITNPGRQELFKTKYAPLVEKGQVGADKRAFNVQQDASLADVNRQLSELQDAGLKAKDEASRAFVIKSGQNLINTLEANEYINKQQAEKYRQQWVQGFAVKSIQALPPEDRINLLRTAPQTTDEVLDRIGGIENATGNPAARAATSSAMGNFQFTKGTWAATIAAARPDLAQGRSIEQLTNDKAIQDMRADPTLSRQMAGVLLAQNAASLKAAGLEATPGNLYLAHFLGSGDAIRALKADPNRPIAGLISQDSIDANQSVLAGKQAGTVVNWANRKMGGVGPKNSTVSGFIPEADKPALLDQANKEVAAIDIDGQRAQKQAIAQAKQVSDDTENSLLKDLYSEQPKTTVRDIVNNDRLTREAKERMIGVAQRALADDKTDKTYGKGFYEFYQRVHAPDGDPNKITDPGMLYQHVGPGGALTVAGVDKLFSEIQARRTPEGVAEGEMKKQFLSTIKGQISGSDEGLHIKDPKGDELYLKWLATALPAYDAAKKAGKTPAQLLDPSSPDYVGKTAEKFKRPMSQWFGDVVQGGATTAVQPFDVSKVKTLDELVAAYRAGKVTKAIADELAISNGWAVRRTSAPVGVPVSQ